MTPVTHVTEQRPPAALDAQVQGGRSAALATAFVRGGLAAGLGLGALAVLVTAAWIASPFPDGGPAGALHTAAGLWLLAHGADLLRTDTVSGVPAPLGVTPLLLTALPLWLAHRAARDTLDPDEGRPRPSTTGAVAAVTGGYLLVAAAVVVYTEAGALPAELLTTGAWTPVTVLAAAATGAWTAHGRPLPDRERHAVALRAAGPALAVFGGGGTLLLAVSLGLHAGEARVSFEGLAGEWSGRASLALLTLALLPNAVLWALSYALGTGFSLGTGALVTPLGLTGTPAVPDFPLLAALPGGGPGRWPHAAVLAVPVLAALVAGHRVGRAGRGLTARDTALTALGTAGVCGAAVALLTAVAGGPLGPGRLAAFGPVWWQTGTAAALWCGAVGVPTAFAVRAWGRRAERRAAARGFPPVPGPAPVPEAEPAAEARPAVPPPPAPEAVGALARLDALEALDAEDDGVDEGYGFLPAAWEPSAPARAHEPDPEPNPEPGPEPDPIPEAAPAPAPAPQADD
ncbi:DUF6350 family protein [Streptomyces sp. NPDC046275]|uniref:cell division protein PerM n=1 Tax=Streptomyces sp. NPDC046275 TaxID=3157201 RepID=UPI0033EC0C23